MEPPITGSEVLTLPSTGFVFPANGPGTITPTSNSLSFSISKNSLVYNPGSVWNSFPFNLPSGNRVVGIELKATRQRSTGSLVDYLVIMGILYGPAVFQSNSQDKAGTWPDAATEVTYGGPTDTWGFPEYTLNTDDTFWNSSILYFFVENNAFLDSSSSGALNNIQMNIYYEPLSVTGNTTLFWGT